MCVWVWVCVGVHFGMRTLVLGVVVSAQLVVRERVASHSYTSPSHAFMGP